MSIDGKIRENERELMESYQERFDKAKRNKFTPHMTYWMQKIWDLEKLINDREDKL